MSEKVKIKVFVIFNDFEPAGFVNSVESALAYLRHELEEMKDGESVEWRVRREDMTEERLASLPVQ